MALSIDEANTVSSKFYDEGITQQVYEKSPVFYKLKKKGKVTKGGTQIQWAVRYTTLGNANAVGAREQIPYIQKETRTAAVLDWKYYVSTTSIQWDERVKNSGKPQIVDLLKDKAEELREDMFNKFQTDLYSTSQASKSFSSLWTIIDSADTYAGIAVADASVWAANEDGTTTRLTLYGDQSLSEMINASAFGSDGVDFMFTTRDLFSKFESLLEPQKRYEDTEMANGGFTTLKFHGIPVVSDYACTSGYWGGIDTDYFEFRTHPDFDFKVDPWKELGQAGYPQAMYKSVFWTGNLVCKSRQTCFKYTALDFTA